ARGAFPQETSLQSGGEQLRMPGPHKSADRDRGSAGDGSNGFVRAGKAGGGAHVAWGSTSAESVPAAQKGEVRGRHSSDGDGCGGPKRRPAGRAKRGVEHSGIEPLTFSLRTGRSTN